MKWGRERRHDMRLVGYFVVCFIYVTDTLLNPKLMSLWNNYYYSGLQISQTTCSTYRPLHCIGFFYPLMFGNKCYCVFSNCKIRPAMHSQTRVTQAIVYTAFSQFCFKLIPRLLKWTWKLSLYCLFFWLVKSPLTGGGYNIHAQFLGS